MRKCICNLENNNVLGANTIIPNNTCLNCNRDENLLDTLCKYIGCRCLCEFVLRDFDEIEERSGVLEEVGCDYLALRNNNGRRLLCSTENLNFVTIL